ncbi:hypothetical protein MC885_017094 [Smutsia gigantea]|nr:hypothetical protein MC885_017094 [Smutsia gigantea]
MQSEQPGPPPGGGGATRVRDAIGLLATPDQSLRCRGPLAPPTRSASRSARFYPTDRTQAGGETDSEAHLWPQRGLAQLRGPPPGRRVLPGNQILENASAPGVVSKVQTAAFKILVKSTHCPDIQHILH